MNFPIGLSTADKFKLIREREGNLSQRAFADLIGISRGIISQVEVGRNKPGLDVISKIAAHPQFLPYAMWLIVDEITDEQAEDAMNYLRSLQEGKK